MFFYPKNNNFNKCKILIFSILQFYTCTVFAQFTTREQMERELVYTSSDTTRLRLMISLVDSIGNNTIWEPLNERAYLLAKKLSTSNDKRTQYLAKIFLADAINNRGFAHKSRGETKETLADYFECLKIREEIGYQSGIASSFNNLSHVFSVQGDTVRALNYLQKSLEIRKTLNDQHGIAQSLSNMGQLYLGRKNINAALFCLEQSISIFKTLEGKTGLDKALTNIGDIHFVQKEYEMARNNFEESLLLLRQAEDEENVAYTILKIADIDFIENNLKNSEKRAKEVLAIAINKQYTNVESLCYELLSNIFDKKGNTKLAFEYYKKHIEIQIKIKNVNVQNQLAKYQFEYETAKEEVLKQNQIEESKKNTRQQRILYIMLIAFLAISVAVLYYISYLRAKANKSLEEKNRQVELARMRAEESENYKSQFLSNMSHEIRTPMNAIVGMSALLFDTDLDEKQAAYTSAIRNSSENLSLIINDVLDFSKLEQGKMSLELNPFSMQKTVSDVYNTMRFKAEEKGLKFNYFIDKEVADYLIGDGFRLYQVLINLVSNAIKFTSKGSVSLFAEVVNYQFENNVNTNQSIKFSVQDTGMGIPEEKINNIFKSFEQATADTSRKFGGTGLGLSISQQLVALRDSKIEVKSEIGKGSVFYFTIDYKLSSREVYQQAQGLEIIEAPIKLKYFNILLAEDNEYNRIVARESLQKVLTNATIQEVENGQKVLDALRLSDFDVILMDISMPEMDGYETTKIIRSTFPSHKSNIPIIALTAFTNKEEEEKIYAAGMNSHVYKPFKINDLVNVIAKNTTLTTLEKIPNMSEYKSINELVNLSFLEDFTENDQEQMQYFIQKFVDTIPAAIQQLDEAILALDFQQIKKKAHNIKPQIAFVGILEAVKKIENIEHLASEKQDLEPIKTLFLSVKDLVHRSILYYEKNYL
jgi:signal transduction histidine kinase/FixJ family two-component response regulator